MNKKYSDSLGSVCARHAFEAMSEVRRSALSPQFDSKASACSLVH